MSALHKLCSEKLQNELVSDEAIDNKKVTSSSLDDQPSPGGQLHETMHDTQWVTFEFGGLLTERIP